MTPKQRVISALNHEQPDKVPTGENQIDGGLAEQILSHSHLCNMGWKELQAIWSGRRDEVVSDYCSVLVRLPKILEWDYVRVPTVPAVKEYREPEMTGKYSWLDENGLEVHFNPEAGSVISHKTYPDLNLDDLPDPDADFVVDSTELEAIRCVVRELGESCFIVARSPVDGTFPWEQTVGMESLLIKMITDPDFVEKAVSGYVNQSVSYIKAMLEAGADAIMTADDYCDNRGPIMGVDLFRRFILPGMRRQCEVIHKLGGYFIKHTDGNTWDILDDLVDIGIDGWHGIQRNIGMDMGRLKNRFGRELCLFGGVNTESLINGTPELVREEVRTAIAEAGREGGLVLTCSNVVTGGTKLENFWAMRKAILDYGSFN
jgi:hypothetical protein